MLNLKSHTMNKIHIFALKSLRMSMPLLGGMLVGVLITILPITIFLILGLLVYF